MCLIFSFTSSKRDCHITFGVSPKLRVIDESKDGNSRVYADSKETFKLGIDRIETKFPEKELNDSLKIWMKDCRTSLLINSIDYDTLEINNITLRNINFLKPHEEATWIHNIFVFYTNSHYYKMEFSFPNSKEDKGKREMSKILSSLSVIC